MQPVINYAQDKPVISNQKFWANDGYQAKKPCFLHPIVFFTEHWPWTHSRIWLGLRLPGRALPWQPWLQQSERTASKHNLCCEAPLLFVCWPCSPQSFVLRGLWGNDGDLPREGGTAQWHLPFLYVRTHQSDTICEPWSSPHKTLSPVVLSSSTFQTLKQWEGNAWYLLSSKQTKCQQTLEKTLFFTDLIRLVKTLQRMKCLHLLCKNWSC